MEAASYAKAKAGPNSGFREFALRVILAEREAELLELKGPCSDNECRLHYAHRGPHDIRKGD